MLASRRMIDAAFWRSETVASLTMMQRLLFIGLFSNADDQGRMKAHPALIRSQIFPYDDIPTEELQADLDAIEAHGCIHTYDADDGRRYLQIVNWWRYQHLKWAWPSELPAPPGWTDRLRYRQGNTVIEEAWDGDPAVEPQWDRDETDAEPAPSGSGSTSNSERRESASAGASAPPTLSEPEQVASTPRRARSKDPPAAVRVFRENAHRYPRGTWYADVERIVGTDEADLERWGRVVRAWIGLGWNPSNVMGMLDYYQRNEIPPGASNGQTGHRGRAEAAGKPALTAANDPDSAEAAAERDRAGAEASRLQREALARRAGTGDVSVPAVPGSRLDTG